MKKDTTSHLRHFESMLWQNELEYNRRELAIFESYLLNKGACIQPYKLTDLMSQLHQYLQSVDKLLDEIRPETRVMPLAANGDISKGRKTECAQWHIREEMFYFEQSYRQFRHRFCSFAEGLEVA
ncbi:hypothetical protein [Salmonirosea aquatica]|uniref:Uncharacterized protein n=1 Tax=Salmonirosea aquatica TaxID=2654236 RepID=A0A7C9FBK7_9BACT|nr:hypothetical protein [Cytophagaceae bacterium SJW1-29]